MIGELLEMRRLLRAPRLPPGALERMRDEKLAAIVRHAHDHVPYYRTLLRDAGVTPGDIRSVADLARIPISTKADLKRAGEGASVPRAREPRGCTTLRTSGSTGIPFALRVSPSERTTRRLVNFRALLGAGVRRGDVVALAGPEHGRSARWHDRLGWFRTGFFAGTLPAVDMARRIRALAPTVLWVYPSVLRSMLIAVDFRLERICTPRMLITSAEAFDPVLRARIDPAIETFDFYGSNEVGRIAQECPVHEGLHVNADQVIVETVPREAGAPAEVIVTSLAARVSPFLRYRLDDLGEAIGGRCACGSSFPRIAAPEGRHWDLIRLPSGRVVSPMVCAVVLRRAGAIDQYRLVQHARHRFVLELVPGTGFRDGSLREIEAGLRAAIGEPVTIDVRRVDTLAAPVGKYRVFESRLDEAG